MVILWTFHTISTFLNTSYVYMYYIIERVAVRMFLTRNFMFACLFCYCWVFTFLAQILLFVMKCCNFFWKAIFIILYIRLSLWLIIRVLRNIHNLFKVELDTQNDVVFVFWSLTVVFFKLWFICVFMCNWNIYLIKHHYF